MGLKISSAVIFWMSNPLCVASVTVNPVVK